MPETYAELQWRLLQHFASSEADDMDVEAMAWAASEIERLRAENADLRTSVVAFGGLWAATYARNHGLPDGHLDAKHYDILARAGARMDDFVRDNATEPGIVAEARKMGATT